MFFIPDMTCIVKNFIFIFMSYPLSHLSLSLNCYTCKEIPLLAASEIIATFFSPFMNLSFSVQFNNSRDTVSSVERDSYLNSPVLSFITTLPLRPVISATRLGPPSSSIRWSSVFAGSSWPSSSILARRSS